MSSITNDIEVKQVGADVWKLLAPVTYTGDDGDTITAPIGFETDFASTPRIAWAIGMPKSGAYDPAAVVHDYLYTVAGKVPWGNDQGIRIYSKSQADAIFEDALRLLGVGRFKRWIMYQAVKKFGKGNYDN